MKSPRKPSNPSPDEARRTNVLMEKMLSEFRTFGESLSIVRERGDRVELKLDKIGEDVELLKSVMRTNSKDIQAIRADLKTYNQRLELVETKLPS